MDQFQDFIEKRVAINNKKNNIDFYLYMLYQIVDVIGVSNDGKPINYDVARRFVPE